MPPSLCRREPRRIGGFSLIEVTISLGIIAFALVAVVGLLPSGLSAQKQASQQARAAQVLNQVSRSLLNVGTNQNFLPPLTNLPVAAGSTNMGFFRDGTIGASGTEREGSVYVGLDNPTSTTNVCRAVVSVAWPASATRISNAWTKNQGSMDAVLFINRPQ
ncbi:MAG: hypothetical protein FGM15_12760 [Chthoniobacterales bacterium]|nr:hypothetical protein [Chthoniobacterales bacterium]